MHESSLAKQILSMALRAARESGGGRVIRARGAIAETEALSGEAIRMQFEAHARGTEAEGAELDFDLVHVEARCGACGTIYRPEHHVLLCPACGGLEGEELGERGIRLDAIELSDGATTRDRSTGSDRDRSHVAADAHTSHHDHAHDDDHDDGHDP